MKELFTDFGLIDKFSGVKVNWLERRLNRAIDYVMVETKNLFLWGNFSKGKNS